MTTIAPGTRVQSQGDPIILGVVVGPHPHLNHLVYVLWDGWSAPHDEDVDDVTVVVDPPTHRPIEITRLILEKRWERIRIIVPIDLDATDTTAVTEYLYGEGACDFEVVDNEVLSEELLEIHAEEG